MLSKVWSAATHGIDAVRITIEVDAAQAAQPGFTLVGLPDAAVREASLVAITAYRGRRWDESERGWRQVLERHPMDTIAQLYVERIQRCRLVAPAREWDGAVELEKL